ncbi:DUF5825 family protein [Micromonospora sp. NPDC050397]|uniref:DUF5825 family protein n=1 Tax=Micromonospora sp. NPDC050397 TaxID=3364279 RepID=UPI00384CA53A
MRASRADWAGSEVRVELSRDYEPRARHLPGMALGQRTLTGPWGPVVAELYGMGARYARIDDPVDLCAGADVTSARALVLIRELTARGIAVAWVARCLDGCVGDDLFTHLYPPVRVDGAPDSAEAARWREPFFLGKCVSRRGPGFIEVRDRRFGSLEMLTIDEPGHLAVIAATAEGVVADEVPADVRRELTDARVVTEHAGHLWWLPTRTHRWAFPAMAV